MTPTRCRRVGVRGRRPRRVPSLAAATSRPRTPKAYRDVFVRDRATDTDDPRLARERVVRGDGRSGIRRPRDLGRRALRDSSPPPPPTSRADDADPVQRRLRPRSRDRRRRSWRAARRAARRGPTRLGLRPRSRRTGDSSRSHRSPTTWPPDDDDAFRNVFVRDLAAGVTTLVSRAPGPAGAAATGADSLPARLSRRWAPRRLRVGRGQPLRGRRERGRERLHAHAAAAGRPPARRRRPRARARPAPPPGRRRRRAPAAAGSGRRSSAPPARTSPRHGPPRRHRRASGAPTSCAASAATTSSASAPATTAASAAPGADRILGGAGRDRFSAVPASTSWSAREGATRPAAGSAATSASSRRRLLLSGRLGDVLRSLEDP